MKKNLGTKRIMQIGILLLAAIAIILLAPLVKFFTAGLRQPATVPAPDYWPTDGWRTSTPEEQGFESEKLAQGLRTLQEKQEAIDSLLLIHNGYVVLDAHFAPYDGSFPHDMASVTKSVMTTLIAIAADQGKLDLDQPVVSYFPDRAIANLDERKQRMTARDLASMRNGMESGCYDGDEPTLDAMRSSPDWVQAVLDRPMVAEPGSKNCYDSPGMHLLSAILQETTGMTALEFARQNLFGPLGIQDVVWESDPQGYTHGWGDLHLLPEDAAKIGFLWLHRGQWDGRQIVSEAWVLDSVRPQSKFVKGDFGYGYGWWVSWTDTLASGRGGQKIRVIASRNTILVVTGAYYEYSEVEKWLFPALIGLDEARPADPEGQAALETILAALQQGPAPQALAALPDTARVVSGKTYDCDSNPVNVNSMRLEFNGSDVATIFLTRYGVEQTWPVGLDGKYRLSPDGQGQRGYWEDAQTFTFESFDIGRLNRRIHFDGDRLELFIPEIDLTIMCQVQTP